MRSLFVWIVLVVPLLVLMRTPLIPGPSAQATPAILRFREVIPVLFRGGQPTPEGFGFLKWRGIRTVINLREEHDERELVEKLGMKYVYIPIEAWDTIPNGDINRFLSAVNDPASQPVFVHCQRGGDRTGFMIGLYRIAEQGWSAQQAYREARELGMRWWYRGLKRQLFDFAVRRRQARGAPASETL